METAGWAMNDCMQAYSNCNLAQLPLKKPKTSKVQNLKHWALADEMIINEDITTKEIVFVDLQAYCLDACLLHVQQTISNSDKVHHLIKTENFFKDVIFTV